MDAILAEVEKNGYSAHALIDAIVLSTPFRYQGNWYIDIVIKAERDRKSRKTRRKASVKSDEHVAPKTISRRTLLRGAGVAWPCPGWRRWLRRAAFGASKLPLPPCAWLCSTWPTA